MDEVAVTVRRRGGIATWGELRRVHGRAAILAAVRSGALDRVRRGTYALPDAGEHLRSARVHAATLSHLSAALHHGWRVAVPPTRPEVTVRRKRHLSPGARQELTVHWSDLRPHEVADGVTLPLRTVVDCARALRFAEALAVADSALRSHRVDLDELREAAATAVGTRVTGSPPGRSAR